MTIGTNKYLGRFKERKCLQCFELFIPTSGVQKYCEFDCRQRTWLFKTKRNEVNRKYRIRYSERNRNVRQRRKYWINKYKVSKGCQICGFDKDAICLDFDHIDPKIKLFTIGNCYKMTIKVLITEIRKCRILCANCHRLETTNKNQWGFRK